MDIVTIGSASVKNQNRQKPVTRGASRKNGFVERRRNREDRRKSVRDGVVVSFSYRNDRRVNPDRRRS
jgi:hypothetical protein